MLRGKSHCIEEMKKRFFDEVAFLCKRGKGRDAKRASRYRPYPTIMLRSNPRKGRDAKRASRYLLRKHVRSHGFSTYADFCRFPQTRAFGAQTVLQRQS